MGNTFNSSLRWMSFHFHQNLILPDPELFDSAHRGRWPSLILRSVTHPHEASWTDRHRNTALHLVCRRQPPIDVVFALLRAFPYAASIQTVEGMTPLHFACYCGSSVDVVRMLIEASADAVSVRDRRDRTPLHCACAGYRADDKHEVIRALLEIDPHLACLSDDRGRTPLTLMLDDYWEEIEERLEEIEERLNKSENEGSGEQLHLSSSSSSEQESQFVSPSSSTSAARHIVSNGISHFQNLPEINLNASSRRLFLGELDECWKCVTLILKAAYHGTVSYRLPDGESFRIVHASVGISTCPAHFIKLALTLQPEQVRQKDIKGNFPLHIAAACPLSKHQIQLHHIQSKFVCVETVLLLYKPAARHPNRKGVLPLKLAIDTGKSWDRGVKAILEAFPQALETMNIDLRTYPTILELVGRDTVLTVLYQIVRAKPDILADAIS